MLEGRNQGQILVEDLIQRTSAVVRDGAERKHTGIAEVANMAASLSPNSYINLNTARRWVIFYLFLTSGGYNQDRPNQD